MNSAKNAHDSYPPLFGGRLFCRVCTVLLLLCVSVVSWAATRYCGETINTSQEEITVTVKKTGELETTFIFESEKLANRAEWQGLNPINLGGGTLSGADFSASTAKAYTSGKLTCVTTWSSYPTGSMDIYFSLYRDQATYSGSDIMTFTLSNIDASATCGSAGSEVVAFDPATIDWTSSENTSTYHKVNEQFQIAAENASNMPTGPLNIQKPEWAAFEGLYVEVPAGVSACAFDDVAVTDGTEYDGNTGAGIVLNPSALTNEITKVTVTHGLGNTIFYVHNANAGAAAFDPENIEWAGVEPVINSDGHYKITAENDANMPSNIEKQQNVGWAENHTGLYVTVPAGISKVEINGIGTVGVDHTYCWINGAGVLLYQEAFTSAVSEVVVTYAGGSKTFYVWTDTPNDTPINPYPSGGNSYCGYTDNDMKAKNANVCLTWGTADNGDVVIKITDGLNASNSSFREGGFENEISFDDSWKVYSGTNYGTIEPASTYFETGTLSNGDKTFTLALKAGKNVPDNAIVAFKGRAFSWKNDQEAVAYHFNKYFAYNYGTNCSYLDVPTDVAVTNAGVITFTSSAFAESYTALVYLDGILKHRQTVTSGTTLTYVPYISGTYQVRVTASAEGYPTTEPSDPVDWILTATPVVVGNSEYCEAALPHDHDKDANISWETDNSGNMTITLLPLSEQTATFRGQGMKLSDFTVGSNRTVASEYFDRVYSEGGTTVVLNLRNPTIKPGQGEPIYFNGYVECTVDGVETWPTANLTYTYGSKCSGQKHVTVAVNHNEMGTATVNGVADVYVDEETQVTCVAAPASGYEFVNWTQGGVEVSADLEYVTTITSNTALVANFETHRTAYCAVPLNTTADKTLYLTITNPSANTYKILLEGSADNKIESAYNNFNFVLSHINGETGNTALPAASWTIDNSGYGSAYVTFTAENFREVTFVNKYVVFDKQGGGLTEFNAFPDANLIKWDATCTDDEAPVLAAPTASPLSGTSVRLALSATDNMAVLLTYRITYEGLATPIEVPGAAGEVTYYNVTGLSAGTNYTFSVTVSDGTNVSAPQTCSATPSMPTAPVPTHPKNQVRSIYSDAYPSALEHDFIKNNWAWAHYTEQNIAGNHLLIYTHEVGDDENMRDVAWGEDNDGANAIIAKEGYNDGTNKGLDVRQMKYIHFDMWSAIATTYPEIYLNDTKASGFTLNGSGWQSFDIDISGMTEGQKSNIRWIKFVGFRTPNPEEIAIDNVYFWTEGVPLTPDEGWATYAPAEKVSVPEGITAYWASYNKEGSDEQLVLYEITENVIPAGAGVIIKGTPNGFGHFSTTDAAAPSLTENILTGCPVQTDITSIAETKDIFCIRYIEGYPTSFYQYYGSIIAANKAYLALPKAGKAGMPRNLRFVINQSQITTAVENLRNEEMLSEKVIIDGHLFIRRGDTLYTIQGVRVK